MSECLICLEYIQEKDSKGKAWLSCNCYPQYHAMCLHTWLYTEVIIGPKKRMIKSCPICKDPTLHIVDFEPPETPPRTPPPSPVKPPEPKKPNSFKKTIKRMKNFFVALF